MVLLNINDLDKEVIHRLSHLFLENKGDNQVTFEVMELETIKKLVEEHSQTLDNDGEDFSDDAEAMEGETATAVTVTEVEEIKVVTKLTMPSRRLKIKISNELLIALEKMQINFKLN